MIDYSKFKSALVHLDLQFANYQTLDDSLPELLKEAVAESVIQRFETCYACLWKVLKRFLMEEMGLAEVPNSPRPIIRIASENNLLATPVEQWMRYVEARLATAHDYSGEEALSALEAMADFLADAKALYSTMTGEVWQ